MNNHALFNAASLIAKNNLSDKVISITVTWDEEISKLTVTYFVDGSVSEEEQDLCELTLAELLAEFSDIQLADGQCVSHVHSELVEQGQQKGLVYHRP